jgi:UDP-N-acetylglucosamine acyltransferase
MVGVHIGHNCRIANDVIIANNCLLAGYVEIADRAFIGGGTTFHQNMKVGRLVMAQGSSAFGKDIPPFLSRRSGIFVFGMNVLGMRRPASAERNAMRSSALSSCSIAAVSTRARLWNEQPPRSSGPLGREFFEFVGNAKKRGILPYRYAGEEGEA